MFIVVSQYFQGSTPVLPRQYWHTVRKVPEGLLSFVWNGQENGSEDSTEGWKLIVLFFIRK